MKWDFSYKFPGAGRMFFPTVLLTQFARDAGYSPDPWAFYPPS